MNATDPICNNCLAPVVDGVEYCEECSRPQEIDPHSPKSCPECETPHPEWYECPRCESAVAVFAKLCPGCSLPVAWPHRHYRGYAITPDGTVRNAELAFGADCRLILDDGREIKEDEWFDEREPAMEVVIARLKSENDRLKRERDAAYEAASVLGASLAAIGRAMQESASRAQEILAAATRKQE